MEKPICPICKGKTTENKYIWDDEKKKLFHNICYKISKKSKAKDKQSVTVPTETLTANTLSN